MTIIIITNAYNKPGTILSILQKSHYSLQFYTANTTIGPIAQIKWNTEKLNNLPKVIQLVCDCYGLNICVPPNSYVEILTPKMVVLGGTAFGRYLGHMGGSHEWDYGLIKETPESSLSLSTIWGHMRRLQRRTRKRALTRTQPCWHLDLGLPGLQNCEK